MKGAPWILKLWLVAIALVGLHESLTDTIFSEDFEDSYDQSFYKWSSIEPANELPSWQRQWPIEDCPTYAARYLEEDLWGCCGLNSGGTAPRPYWTRPCGTNTGHRCDLETGDEYLWVIFMADFEWGTGLACWSSYTPIKCADPDQCGDAQ